MKLLLFSSHMKWSELHFSESQRVAPVALPVIPHHTVSVRRCVVAGVVVEAVQVGVMTGVVPPATFVVHCTRAWPRVVVLVSSAELLSKMPSCQCITFKQQTEHLTRFTKVHYCITISLK